MDDHDKHRVLSSRPTRKGWPARRRDLDSILGGEPEMLRSNLDRVRRRLKCLHERMPSYPEMRKVYPLLLDEQVERQRRPKIYAFRKRSIGRGINILVKHLGHGPELLGCAGRR